MLNVTHFATINILSPGPASRRKVAAALVIICIKLVYYMVSQLPVDILTPPPYRWTAAVFTCCWIATLSLSHHNPETILSAHEQLPYTPSGTVNTCTHKIYVSSNCVWPKLLQLESRRDKAHLHNGGSLDPGPKLWGSGVQKGSSSPLQLARTQVIWANKHYNYVIYIHVDFLFCCLFIYFFGFFFGGGGINPFNR